MNSAGAFKYSVLRLVATLIGSVALSGCALFLGAPHDENRLVSQQDTRELREGMTMDQVLRLLGQPRHREVIHAEQWQYVYSAARSNGGEVKRIVSVYFENGRVKGIQDGGARVDVFANREMTPIQTAPAKTPDTRAEPVVAAPVAPAAPKAAPPATPRDVAIWNVVQQWASAWANREVIPYLKHYSDDFQPPGDMSVVDWGLLRRQRLLGPRDILLDVSNPTIETIDANTAKVEFTQYYVSNLYWDRGTKRLVLRQETGGWKIIREQWWR